jgi:RimK family alpha-L-glutamate ligase
LKIGIIASDRAEWHVDKLFLELKKHNVNAYLLPVTRFQASIGYGSNISVKGYSVDGYDAVIVRRVPGGSVEQVIYRMDALFRLEQNGVRVINPAKSIERTVDKYMTSALLKEAGIQTPKTIVTESISEAMRAYNSLGGDVVVKPLFGSLGLGMTRVSDEDVAYRVFRALEMMRSVYYIQEFISHPGMDLRLFILNGSLIASMRRVAKSWKTNISGGGKPEKYEPSEEIADICIKATKVLGLIYTGVDVIISEDGTPYVIELNSTPGWKGLQTVSRVNIAEALIEHILTTLK